MKLLNPVFISFWLLFSMYSFGQESYKFEGKITTSGADIPFELNLTYYRGSGKVTGNSATWKGSEYEVFTKISAEYNPTSNMLSFVEKENLNMRSNDINREFCFVKGSYEVKEISGQSVIEGAFTAKRKDGTVCPPGQLRLVSSKIFPPPEPKTVKPEPTNQTIAIDTVRKGFLTTHNTYVYKTNSGALLLQWGDFSNQDGDSITITVNGKVVMYQLSLTNNMKSQKLKLNAGKTDTIRVRMLNEGRVSPNTSMLNFFDEEKGKYYNFQINGKKDEDFILLIMDED